MILPLKMMIFVSAAAATFMLPLPGARLAALPVGGVVGLGAAAANWLEFKPKHNADGLEKILKDHAALPPTPDSRRFDREEQFAMSDTVGMDAEPKVFVVASSREETADQFHPHLFRNYEPARGDDDSDDSDESSSSDDDRRSKKNKKKKKKGSKGSKLRQTGSNAGEVWEVARATSAAPMMFSPFTIDDEQFVDGGLCANNPIELAMKEAQDIWPGRKIGAILSLGCGGQDKSDDAGLWAGLLGNAKKSTVRNTLTGTYEAHRSAMQDLCAKDDGTTTINALSGSCVACRPREKVYKKCRYLRLNPILGESIPMDSTNAKQLGYLRQCTESFLAEQVTQRELREMIAILDPDGKGVGRPQLHTDDMRAESKRNDAYVGDAEDDDWYRVGAKVSVFSKSADRWFDGSITKIDRRGKVVAVEYKNTLQGTHGATMAKSLEFGSPDLTSADKASPRDKLAQTGLRRSFREPEPEPEPAPAGAWKPSGRRRSGSGSGSGSGSSEDDGLSGRKIMMLEDDQDLKRQGSRPVVALPENVVIQKHETEGKTCWYLVSYLGQDGLPAYIRRRYSEFDKLRSDIIDQDPGVISVVVSSAKTASMNHFLYFLCSRSILGLF